ncbi:hypothetical protein SCHPADRAFT_934588 [Schizopora paradoxa]|uniref:DRBM domain-containing protein n=1 Tax=Schizopora paradoxa TaxID=27342 RepID=A0A0H2SA92_9AGAM|nr:hypothetical protein SCHPADRAFT_934588 [Schizopora paradoxa]
MSADNHHSPTTNLNNLLQQRGESDKLSWEEKDGGTQNNILWTLTCKFNGNVLGTGVARTKGEAKNKASQQALEKLKSQ